MNTEEKAKAYDEAIKRAKNCLDEKRDTCLVRPDVIFPELQESEDEKIRKMLIKFFGKGAENDSSTNGISDKDIVAWLEKQGEPNPYSGVSFTYNGHTWGMCARDNGVDILLDEQLFKHLEKRDDTSVYYIPEISIKDAVDVTSRMQYIEDDMKPIADFIIDYAYWDLHKDEWNQPTLTVPLFRVLDALIQRGKPYCGCSQNNAKQGEQPDYCHHEVDLSNCSEEYRKAYYDGWNNCNMQYSRCKSESDDVVKCLINGMKFYYEVNEEATWGTEKFSMRVKDILSWLEKQNFNVDNANKEYWRGYREGKQVILDKYAELEKQGEQADEETITHSETDGYNVVDPKFKVKFAENEYNVLEVKDVDGVTFYGIEDEPNHIDYVKADNCEIIDGGYSIKSGGASIPTKPAMFSEQKPAKNIVETWKDMRLEVYQQASGNRHEPNCSDDTTKMFSLNDVDEIIEKLNEQKSIDKVEPKFKVGDWITNSIETVQFTGYDIDYGYQVDYEGNLLHRDTDIIEKEYRLWNINDAKDGDVLVDEDNNIGIYKGKDDIDWDSYTYLGCDGKLRGFSIGGRHKQTDTHPATKEQRVALEKAMADAEYTLDFEKKELKKIENEIEECKIEHIEHGKYYYCIKDYFCGGKKQASKGDVVQALRGMSIMALGAKANEYFLPVNFIKYISAWSEEDEANFNEALSYIKDDTLKEFIKSIKQRIGG